MQTQDGFHFDHQRHVAAATLQPAHLADFNRLVKNLRFGSRFQFLLAEYNDAIYRDLLIRQLNQVLTDEKLRTAQIVLSQQAFADFAAVETEMLRLAAGVQALHVIDDAGWFDAGRWEACNIRREALARDIPLRLIFWLRPAAVSQLAMRAPDLWAWRGGVFAFTRDLSVPLPVLPRQPEQVDPRSLAQRSKRIAELRACLQAATALPEDMRLQLLDELADLLFSLGEYAEALRIRREEVLPSYEQQRNLREKAVTTGKIADILQARGELDAALRILREEVLPVFESLGDVLFKAVTMSKIADILQTRGELDAALRIRQEEVLPVFERLGDVRSKAVTMSGIADILQTRGELDAALRIRREEELPVYEQLGDVRSKAVAMGKVADVLQSRRELDAALRIRQEEELPVYERLGDMRFRAITMGRIADILQARGELNAALRIRQEDELPVYERLGDLRSKAVTMSKVADILQERGEQDAALLIFREELVPVFDRLGDVREQAITKAKIAYILQARGELNAALQILQEEVLPVFERQGDIRNLLIGRVRLALLLQQKDPRGNNERIMELLLGSFAEAKRLGLPEAGQIEEILRRSGWNGAPGDQAAERLQSGN